MNKYMFLYRGPAAVDVGLNHPPLTQAGLAQWAQSIGASLVDRGNLFGVSGISIVDNGTLDAGPPALHGYSIVQAQSLTEASALVRGHPFLSNGGQGNFEIQIVDLTDGERPLEVIPAVTLPSLPAHPTSQIGQPLQPPPEQPTPQTPYASPQPSIVQPTNPYGELDVPHGANQPPEDENQTNQRPPQL